MAYIGLVQRLKGEIGDALRDPTFKKTFFGAEQARREAIVAEHIRDKGIDATVISVVESPEDNEGDFRVEWQPKAGGPHQHQWFSPSQRLP